MSNGKKKAILYGLYPVTMVLVTFGLNILFTAHPLRNYADGVMLVAPYIMVVLFMVTAWRLGEKHIWGLVGIATIIAFTAAMILAEESAGTSVFFSYKLTWAESFQWNLLGFSMIYTLPSALACALYSLLKWWAGKKLIKQAASHEPQE